jgi:DeoR/GlpR family transcriptional regulator of sugar metabolism
MRTLADERRSEIVTRLRQDGRVVAAQLVADFGVSRDTIRRDLDELAAAGVLKRVHGGALPAATGGAPWSVRREQAVEAKEAIANATAKLLRSGQVIFLDAGTTALEVARALPPDLDATIVTNSPPAAAALADHPTAEVILLGGQLRKDAIAAAGAATVEAIERIQADVCILGVCSLHPEIGISVLDLEESYVKRAMIDHAAEVVAVTAADKLGSAGPYVVAPLDQRTHLVTDSTVSKEALAPFRKLGIEVTLA